jgi:hypothetical protein
MFQTADVAKLSTKTKYYSFEDSETIYTFDINLVHMLAGMSSFLRWKLLKTLTPGTRQARPGQLAEKSSGSLLR